MTNDRETQVDEGLTSAPRKDTGGCVFTPGPWRVTTKRPQVKFSGVPDKWVEFISVESEQFHCGGGVALVHVKDEAVTRNAAEVTAANARLISAAPDMLAALQQASFCLRELLPNDADAKMTVALINAAIAKAAP